MPPERPDHLPRSRAHARARRRVGAVAVAAVAGVLAAACSSGSSSSSTTTSAAATTSTAATTTSAAAGSTTSAAGTAALPADIAAVMAKPRYAKATWSLLVTDVKTGESYYPLNADRMSFTGSTRKLFSVGAALNALGPDARQTTPVYRQGTVGAGGVLQGNLVLVGAGDLAFGGRRVDANTVQYTNFDHNDANGLGTAILTPQDPLFALDDLARQVKAAGITSVSGDVVVDSRLFVPYRVPNGNLLITPTIVNENMVDVTVTPTAAGQPATIDYRPRTAAFTVGGSVQTAAAGTTTEPLALTDDGRPTCWGTPGCSGTVSGQLPAGYQAPLSHEGAFVGTFRVEDPDAFARTAFIEALGRAGVAVSATAVAPNPSDKLSPTVLPGDYPADTRVAAYQSAPFAQTAQLVLKVSLNLGANVSLSLLGLSQGQRTIETALAAERQVLIGQYGVKGDQFDFPTNGSGTPDSQAAPRALVQLLVAMSKTPVASQFQAALPVMGENGSLADTGTDLPGKGHVFAKPGTTIIPDDAGTLQLKAQNLAGYIQTKSGRTVAYALMVNDAGAVHEIDKDVADVFTDEATISNAIYLSL